MVAIEISVDSLESAIAAQDGGAQRIELCSALREGGLTPSMGLIRAVRSHVQLPLFLLIRPRSGDFLYSGHDFAIMREDIRVAAQEGADGIVLGLLTAHGDVDTLRTRDLVELARPMDVTFHRAFDMTRDIDLALENVIQTGAKRVLTSGGERDAIQGRAKLGALVLQAKGRISLVVGGGVRLGNIGHLAQGTGAVEFHSSLRRQQKSSMQYQNHAIHLGHSGVDDYTRNLVLAGDVQELVQAASHAARTAAIP